MIERKEPKKPIEYVVAPPDEKTVAMLDAQFQLALRQVSEQPLFYQFDVSAGWDYWHDRVSRLYWALDRLNRRFDLKKAPIITSMDYPYVRRLKKTGTTFSLAFGKNSDDDSSGERDASETIACVAENLRDYDKRTLVMLVCGFEQWGDDEPDDLIKSDEEYDARRVRLVSFMRPRVFRYGETLDLVVKCVWRFKVPAQYLKEPDEYAEFLIDQYDAAPGYEEENEENDRLASIFRLFGNVVLSTWENTPGVDKTRVVYFGVCCGGEEEDWSLGWQGDRFCEEKDNDRLDALALLLDKENAWDLLEKHSTEEALVGVMELQKQWHSPAKDYYGDLPEQLPVD